MDYQLLGDNPKNIPHECLVAVDENGHALLIKSEPSLFENGVFDGHFLDDTITDKKNMPFECGIYKCKIMVYAYSYFTGDTTEYDMNVWCEDVVKLNIE